MFASLKNKIKEETGSDGLPVSSVSPHQRLMNHTNSSSAISYNNNNRMRSRFSSSVSITSQDDNSNSEQQILALRQQCQDLAAKTAELQVQVQQLQEEKLKTEKANGILLESVRVAQTQKDIYCEEQEKIQNIQQNEIEKLRNLLLFREQEAVDRLNAMRQHQQQVENLTSELERLKHYEPEVEDLKDDLQQLRHSSQQEKNQLTTTLAAIEEDNRHLKMRLDIVEKARLEALNTMSSEEKIQALVQERKLLEQLLEEAHLQLSDIKSSWSGQNLALETQVSRLSKQVAEETTEKRKIMKQRDELTEKVKHLEFELVKDTEEIKQRDDKIKLLEEEIDELNLALKECREENEQQILFERNKSESLENDKTELKTMLEAANERFEHFATDSTNVTQNLRQQLQDLQRQLGEMTALLETEKEEKLSVLLKNAEISQSEELLRKELRQEKDEANEVHEKNKQLELDMKLQVSELEEQKRLVEDMQSTALANNSKLKEIEDLQREVVEKNKTIKVLNQRLNDLKKTLQKEFGSAKAVDESAEQQKSLHANSNLNGSIVMDEVNFTYLKHVIVKFLTSREVEARHLIRAVATLLKLSSEEEKLLHDTLNWKMSWFGTKPNHGSGQRAFSIPPS